MNILDYIKGNRRGKHARKIELEAMQDPFLSDAIEGFDSVKGDHANKIAQMQAKISARSSSSKSKKYLGLRIAAAAIVVIGLLSGYFTLMNHQTSMLSANENDGIYINIYAPEEYIDKKRAELAEIQERQPNSNPTLKAVVDIENLNEVMKPFEPMNIYIPESYAEMQKGNNRIEEELFSTPNKQTDKLYAVAEKANENISDNDFSSKKDKIYSQSTTERWSISNDTSHISLGAAYSKEESKEAPLNAPLSESFADYSLAKRPSSSKIITGKVLDQNGEPLVGAIISEKGSDAGAVTDIDGYFSLNTKTNSPEIVAKYIGFEPVIISNPSNQQDIILKEDRLALDEVVVIGYGTQKKSSITGSISSVKANNESFYKKAPVPSAGDAITGKLAGVQVKQAEQSESKIRIRGASSLDSAENKNIVPKPLIGEKEYKKYLENNLIRPTTDECKNKKGEVVVEFSVDNQGSPINIIVVKSICNAFDNEAIRLVKNGSKWTTGNQKVKVEVKF